MEAPQKAQKMKKSSYIFMLIAGILLFLLSYIFDRQAGLFFGGIGFPAFDAVLSIASNFGVVVFVSLIIPSIILYRKNKKPVYLLWLSFVVSIASAFIIKLTVLRPRPAEAFTYPFVSITNYSFPSMHAMAVFSLLPLLIKYLPRQKHFWVVFAFLVSFSRIYFGFHFLSDVVFGALFGYFIGIFLLKSHERKKLWK